MTLANIPRYDSDQISTREGKAVVVGAGMAGLLAARVLRDAFETVTVVERDPLPDDPVPRSGVPQGRHFHGLAEAARATLEDLFPGYGEELISSGGLVIDMCSDARSYENGGFLARGPERLPMYCATRPLLEQVARQGLLTFDEVCIQPNSHVFDYIVDESGTTVEGVVVRTEDAEEMEITADLVVDASGRTSRTPSWLEEQGYSPPSVDEVTIDVGYSTTMIERPPENRQMFVTIPSAPRTRGATAVPVEKDRWLVTMMGMHGKDLPTDRDEFIDFAATLPHPEYEQLLSDYAWVSEDIDYHPFPSNIRRRYEDLQQFPDNLVVIGDAIASFNPIYGQGMSVAALEALQLHHALAAGGRENLPLRFFDHIEEVVEIAWMMALGADFAFQQIEGSKPRGTDLFDWYLSRLTQRAHTDGELTDAFFRVVRMEKPPTSLLRPSVLWRVFKPTG